MDDRDLDPDFDVREEKPLGPIGRAGVSPSGRIFSDADDPPLWFHCAVWASLAVFLLAGWKLADLAMWAWSHVRIV